MDAPEIGATESIDTLRIVTGAEQMAYIGNALQQPPLKRIGILHIVNKDVGIVCCDLEAQRAALFHRLSHDLKHIVKIQIPMIFFVRFVIIVVQPDAVTDGLVDRHKTLKSEFVRIAADKLHTPRMESGAVQVPGLREACSLGVNTIDYFSR